MRDGSLITGCLGVSSYDISLEKQEVVVVGTIGYDDLHAKIAKTGKQVRCYRDLYYLLRGLELKARTDSWGRDRCMKGV